MDLDSRKRNPVSQHLVFPVAPLLSVVFCFALKGSPDPAVGPPDLTIRLERGPTDEGIKPTTLDRGTIVFSSQLYYCGGKR